MSKTVLSEINGFTVAPNVLVRRYGHLTALVFGAVWRYCQMKDGVCRASLERIARDLNITRMSVMRHIRILVEAGFLEDTTPDLRNRPHIYADTGKVTMVSRLELVERGVSESASTSRTGVTESDSTVTESNSNPRTGVTESDSTVTESNSGVTLSDSHCNLKSLEDSIKIPVKKPVKITTTTTTGGAIFKIYEQEIGPLTPIISEEIGGYLDDPKCPPGYVADAIHEAARQNKRNWAYVRAIINRWMTEGKQARDKPRTGPKVKEPDRPEYERYVEPLEGQYVTD